MTSVADLHHAQVSRSLANIATDLHDIVKLAEEDAEARHDMPDLTRAVALNLEELIVQAKAIAGTLESIDKHFVEWLDRDRS